MNTEISMTIPSRRNSTLITTLVLTAVAVVIPFLIDGYQRTLIQKGLLWIPAIFGVYILYSLLRQVHFARLGHTAGRNARTAAVMAAATAG